MNQLANPSGCLHLVHRKRKTTVRKIAALLLSVLSFGANAQHATTITWVGNDAVEMRVTTDGPVPIAGLELFAGTPFTKRAIFATGTEGDLSFAHWADSDHYSVTTLTVTSAAQTFHLNVDQVSSGDIPFNTAVTLASAYSGLRALVLWADGFEATLPMSHGLNDAVFTFTDIAPAVPEPGQTAMLLAGLGVLGFVARKGGVK